MLKRPPHILVTTPESLYILLTAQKSRGILTDVNTIIVDEIHAVADDKRGAHLTLSLERLDALTVNRAVRIGLSATQKPIETVAHFLTGNHRPDPVVVNIGHKRQMDLAIEVPGQELGPVASNELWDEIYDRICELVQQHRSTLVFVNTRRLAERVSFNLAERHGRGRGWGASWQLGAQASAGCGEQTQEWRIESPGGHCFARTGNRYWPRRSGSAYRIAAVNWRFTPAFWPSRPLARRCSQRPLLSYYTR